MASGRRREGLDPSGDLDAWRDGLLEAVAAEISQLRQQLCLLQASVNENLAILTERTARQNTEMFAQITSDVQGHVNNVACRADKVESFEASLAGRLTGLPQTVLETTTEAPALEDLPSFFEDLVELLGSSAEEGEPTLLQVEESSSVTTLSELDADIARAVEENIPKTYTANEKLTPLQCGFFFWQCQELQITDCRDLTRKSRAILQAGLRHRIWAKGWRPRGSESMVAFLGEKIKTTLKRRRRTSELTESIRTVA